MLVALDFDGVICDRQGTIDRDRDFINDKPVEGSKEAIEWIIENGWEVYILTARTEEDWPLIKKWLKKNKLPEIEITNIKRSSSVYLDDRAIRFRGWKDFIKYYK